MSPVSATYLGIPGYVFFWALFLIAVGFFIQRIVFLVRLMRLGKKENRINRLGRRIINMFIEIFPQRCNLKSVTAKDLAGFGHGLIFWGFGFFFVGYVIFIGFAEGFGLGGYISGGIFETVYSSILDFAGLLVIAAVIWAALRRYVIRPERLELSAEAGIIMIMVFCLMALHYCIEGFGFAAYGTDPGWPPIGSAFARFLSGTGMSTGLLGALHKTAWWLHYALILAFMIYIPRSKHLHILSSFFNIFFRPLDSKVVLEPIPVEALESQEGEVSFGISGIRDLTWKDMLDLYSCAVCGRCMVNCPAHISGKSLSPKDIISDLKEALLSEGPGLLNQKADSNPRESLIGTTVAEDDIWACTTCGACQEVCPVNIEHVRKLLGFRQNLVMSQNKMPESAQIMLRNLQSRGQPWSGAQSLRLRGDWTADQNLNILGEGDNADTLFWVGCTGALIDRNVNTTLSIARVLKAAGLDFAVFGDAEPCCGDPARRAGYDFQFQIQAEENIGLLKNHNIRRIITSCPHCYNAFKNEYPIYGGDFDVIHYTELVGDLIRQGKLKPVNGVNSELTFHDPCYLTRYNGIVSEPRRIIKSIPGARLREMKRSRKKTLCCGGGGGHMWIEEQAGTEKISHIRIEDVAETNAGIVATSCPYCLQMLDEGIEHKGIKDSLKAVDLIELVEASISK